jgi:rhamnosyltransferase
VVSRDCPAWNPSVVEGYLKPTEARIAPNGYWLVVARLEPDNNIHTVVRAYAKSRDLNPLVIVGSFSAPSYEDTVRSLVKILPKGKAVYFLGSILNQDHLGMLRCHCIAYVHGHSVGGTNPSLLEAMSFKNTIIAHDNVFNRDVTEGFALFFKGVEDLAGAMDLVEQHRGNYVDLGAKVYEITRARFRWDNVAASYDALFRQL